MHNVTVCYNCNRQTPTKSVYTHKIIHTCIVRMSTHNTEFLVLLTCVPHTCSTRIMLKLWLTFIVTPGQYITATYVDKRVAKWAASHNWVWLIPRMCHLQKQTLPPTFSYVLCMCVKEGDMIVAVMYPSIKWILQIRQNFPRPNHTYNKQHATNKKHAFNSMCA